MKLKKIASLALAGVMAVSMLAGCGDNTNSNSNTTPSEQPEVVPTSTLLDIINNNQDPAKTMIKFTEDTDFTKMAAIAVGELDYNATPNSNTVAETIKNMTGADAGISTSGISNITTNLQFLGTVYNDKDNKGWAAKNDGNVATAVIVQYIKDVPSEEAAAYQGLATYTNNLQQKVLNILPADSFKNTLADGDNYLSYTYTGKVCMIATKTSAGMPAYYIVYEITQTAALETVEK